MPQNFTCGGRPVVELDIGNPASELWHASQNIPDAVLARSALDLADGTDLYILKNTEKDNTVTRLRHPELFGPQDVTASILIVEETILIFNERQNLVPRPVPSAWSTEIFQDAREHELPAHLRRKYALDVLHYERSRRVVPQDLQVVLV